MPYPSSQLISIYWNIAKKIDPLAYPNSDTVLFRNKLLAVSSAAWSCSSCSSDSPSSGVTTDYIWHDISVIMTPYVKPDMILFTIMLRNVIPLK